MNALRIRLPKIPSQPHFWSFSYLPEGLPKGELIEISGAEAADCAARFLEENPWMHCIWIEHSMKNLPDSVLRRDINRKRILFMDGGKDSSWAASTVLKSHLFPVVVYHAPYASDRELKRFKKQAKESGTTVLLLRDTPSFFWPISLRLRSNQHGQLEILRGGEYASAHMERR